MPARPRPRASTETPAPCSVDLIALTPGAGQLNVLLVEAPGSGGWQLPAAAWREEDEIHAAAARLSHFVLGTPAIWQEQIGAFSEGAHPLHTPLSVATVTTVPKGTPATGSAAWCPTAKLPASVTPRHRAMIGSAVTHVRRAVDYAPVAFHLLPPVFTLTELQQVYEVLLDRRLHKASFRRALAAADAVVATDEWRSEGRGRPAQLFLYDAERRRSTARAVRFE